MEEKELYYVRNADTSDSANRWKSHLWRLVDKYLFKTSPHMLSAWRVFLLRKFGAKIGKGCYIASSVTITRPWDFEMGNISGLDEDCFINPPVKIGDYVSIGNNVHIIAGGHDVRSRGFERTPSPVIIDHGAFVGAGTFIGGGVKIGQASVIAAHSHIVQSIPSNKIVANKQKDMLLLPRLTEQDFQKYRFTYDANTEPLVEESVTKRSISVQGKHHGEDLVETIRVIVSKAVEVPLSSNDDNLDMNDIEGWTSLANMMILADIEKQFGISINADDMFEMTSVNSITAVVSRLMSASNNTEECFDSISVLYPHSPLLSGICKNVESLPFKIAIKCNGKVDTYASLYTHICKAAKVMKDLGLKHGDRILLSAHKDIEYIYLYFASHILGVTNVIVDAESNEERLNYIEQKVQPKFCFGYKSKSIPSLLFEELTIEKEDPLSQSPENLSFHETDIAEILFTTGTTGAPKGVCLSYANIYGSASNINEYIRNAKDDIELLGLPICHSFGMGRIRCNLLKGATIVIAGSFANVQKIFKIIEDEHITGFGVVPAAWAYIKKASGKRMSKFANQINYIEIGSAAMPLETKREMLEMFPNTRICMHYGLTEASRICFQEFHDVEHLMTIGKPVTEKVSVKIFQSNGTEAPIGQSGELCVKGNMVMSHYLEGTDTEHAFYGDYFRTGDNGVIDDQGYIHLLGREKELINVGGKKVSPMEVEDAIISLGVGDCVCVPMKDPDGIMGELVKCYVLKGSTDLNFEQISEGLADKLEIYKRPVAYEWIDKIPQTTSGKKQRNFINA